MTDVFELVKKENEILKKEEGFMVDADDYVLKSVFVQPPLTPSVVAMYYNKVYRTVKRLQDALSYYKKDIDLKDVLKQRVGGYYFQKGVLKSDKEIEEIVKSFSPDSHKIFVEYLQADVRNQLYTSIGDRIRMDSLDPTDIRGLMLARYGEEDYARAFVEENILKFPTASYYVDNEEVPAQFKEKEKRFIVDLRETAVTFNPIKRIEAAIDSYTKLISKYISEPFRMELDDDDISSVKLKKPNVFDAKIIPKIEKISSRILDQDDTDQIIEEIQDLWSNTLLKRYKVFEIDDMTEMGYEGYHGNVIGRAVPIKGKPAFFDEIGGYETQIAYLKNLAEQISDKEILEDINMILLSGPPGTGKTSSVNAFVNSLPSNSKALVTYPERGIAHSYIISKEIAERNPDMAIIEIIDDIDMVALDRVYGPSGLSMFTKMDSASYMPPNFMVIATTNQPEVLDSAMLRPGRTRKILTYNLPDLEERKKIIGIYSEKNKIKVDITSVATMTEEFTGDDIRTIFSEMKLTKDDVDKALENSIEAVKQHKEFIKKRKREKRRKGPRDIEVA